jgi:TPR repeat protein
MMLMYYKKGVELNEPDCMCRLANYYFNYEKEYNKAKKYYLLGINLKHLKSYYYYGLFLQKINKLSEMEKILLEAVDVYEKKEHYANSFCKKSDRSGVYYKNTITKILEQIAIYYDDFGINKENTEKFYKMAIDKGSINAMYNLGHFYFEQKDYENMLQCYLKAIELKEVDSMYELSIYYQNKQDFDNMLKYYLMAIETKDLGDYPEKNLINDGMKDFNIFKVKDLLETVESPSIVVQTQINILKQQKEIMIYDNKKNLFLKLNNIIDCGICYENKLNIDLLCGHCCCTDCYFHLYNNSCPFCRMKF